MATFFYGIGWLLKQHNFIVIIESKFNKKYICLIAGVGLLVLVSPLVFLNGGVNMRTIKYGNYFLFILNALLCSLSVFLIAAFIEKTFNKLTAAFTWIGKNTLIVLLLNSTCIRAYQVLTNGIMSKLNSNVEYAINFIFAIIITVFCCIVSEFINKRMPYLIGKGTKQPEKLNIS